ncbi:exodeoxyribonuclease VII [Fervidobacterium sp. 2310opik-2]|uniref:exodeoxyribonuclease VII n=1 Tax=Fervidobacterium sp. 2310opik-2 TaxID=1755815 RepID=UPI0013E05645|nr:exodeoxyribonuclease VII [Fervidobacterium sp. 2310opik-2]KAF2962203.1 exodeoxyribonuclease VII [Fervidobacterium sp. 2310opik-2]
MEIKNVEKLLNMTEEDIQKLTFKELMELVEFIKTTFLSSELEIEKQIELYSKAILLLTKAKEKLTMIKKQKEEIDRKYEEFINRIDLD